MHRIVSLFLALVLLTLSTIPLSAQQIDPRLQDALNLIEETWPGAIYGERGVVTRTSVTYAFGHIEYTAVYDIPTNTITVDESMRDQLPEVLAYILVHENSHALTPWTQYGYADPSLGAQSLDYCLNNEDLAEGVAARWWISRYGDAGHPDTENPWIAHFNYVAWLIRQDTESGAIGEQRRFFAYIVEAYREACRLDTAAPAPTPTPVPTPAPTASLTQEQRIAELERLVATLQRQIQWLSQMIRDVQYDMHTHY